MIWDSIALIVSSLYWWNSLRRSHFYHGESIYLETCILYWNWIFENIFEIHVTLCLSICNCITYDEYRLDIQKTLRIFSKMHTSIVKFCIIQYLLLSSSKLYKRYIFFTVYHYVMFVYEYVFSLLACHTYFSKFIIVSVLCTKMFQSHHNTRFYLYGYLSSLWCL